MHTALLFSEYLFDSTLIHAEAVSNTHTHTHTHIYIYVCVYVCLCIYTSSRAENTKFSTHFSLSLSLSHHPSLSSISPSSSSKLHEVSTQYYLYLSSNTGASICRSPQENIALVIPIIFWSSFVDGL